jgi:hypothetical protein
VEITMLFRTSRTDASVIGASVALIAGITLAARYPDSFGWWALMACSVTAAALMLLRPFFRARSGAAKEVWVDVSPWGVRMHSGDGLHEAMPWPELHEVSVVTTTDPPPDEDMFIVLRGHRGATVVIPHTAAVESDLLVALHDRLPGFNDHAFICAIATRTDETFIVWRAPEDGDAPVAPPPRNWRDAEFPVSSTTVN